MRAKPYPVVPGPRSREGVRSARAGGSDRRPLGHREASSRWDARLVVMDALTPTVLDADPGIDDALALLLARGSPELDVLALPVSAGNAPPPDTAPNAPRLAPVRRRAAPPRRP